MNKDAIMDDLISMERLSERTMSDMPERTYLKMHAWALQIGTLTDTAYIRTDIVAAKDAEIDRLKIEVEELESELELYCEMASKWIKDRDAYEAEIERLKEEIDRLRGTRTKQILDAYLEEKENG